jgi:hypothetical protein
VKSLELAEQSVAFTADFIKTHESHVAEDGISSTAKAVPLPEPAPRSEIRRFCQTEGLLDSYLLTGCRRSLEAAKKYLQELLREDGVSFLHGPARLGNILLCLMQGYEVLGDHRFLERSNQLVDRLIKWQSGDQSVVSKTSIFLADERGQNNKKANSVEAWQYGILWNGLFKYERVSGLKVILDQLRAALPIIHMIQ